MILALSGHGKYRLVKEYSGLLVTPQNWIKMTPDQRRELVQKFDRAKIRSTMFFVVSSEPDLPCCSYSHQKAYSSGSRLDSASQK